MGQMLNLTAFFHQLKLDESGDYGILKNVLPADALNRTEWNDITLVTQSSINHLHRVIPLATTWQVSLSFPTGPPLASRTACSPGCQRWPWMHRRMWQRPRLHLQVTCERCQLRHAFYQVFPYLCPTPVFGRCLRYYSIIMSYLMSWKG